MTRSTPSPRGTALLITLGFLLIAVTSTAAILLTVSINQLEQQFDNCTRVGDDLLGATDTAILAWLSHKSLHVTLPPHAEQPRVLVLDDTWQINTQSFRVQISAWDQLGMLPLDAMRSDSVLNAAIPENALQIIENVQLPSGVKPGLDLLDRGNANVDIYPSHADEALALGAAVSTHNAVDGESVKINVNTAPISLIDLALRSAGRGGLELILAARSDGERANVGGANDRRQNGAPLLVASSDAWAFRVDIQVGPVRRAWWAVYELRESRWTRVQLLSITH